ncbi:MAG: hypothetical protein ACOY4R_27415 [Pseudomonadota bacterium]
MSTYRYPGLPGTNCRGDAPGIESRVTIHDTVPLPPDPRWDLMSVEPMKKPSAWERFAAFCRRVFKGARHG